jgi:hypothetical protein
MKSSGKEQFTSLGAAVAAFQNTYAPAAAIAWQSAASGLGKSCITSNGNTPMGG